MGFPVRRKDIYLPGTPDLTAKPSHAVTIRHPVTAEVTLCTDVLPETCEFVLSVDQAAN